MAKQMFPETAQRVFNRVFICIKCRTKMRADLLKVKAKKVKCRKCKRTTLRQKHKDVKS